MAITFDSENFTFYYIFEIYVKFWSLKAFLKQDPQEPLKVKLSAANVLRFNNKKIIVGEVSIYSKKNDDFFSLKNNC